MVFVLAAGAATRGSKRWVDVGFFKFQPSEFGKVLFVLALAGLLADRSRSTTRARATLSARRLRARPDPARLPPAGHRHRARLRLRARRGALHRRCALVAPRRARGGQPWSSRSRSSGCCRPPASTCSSRTRLHRLTGFTHPGNDPRGATYNLTQSITAVGAGGLRGRGVRARPRPASTTCPSTRPTSRSRPSRSSAASSARRSCCCSTCCRLARAEDRRRARATSTAAIVAGGIAFMFLFQVFVNAAMTMGIAPITGIPLPFVSVGGSSMITNFLAIGILQAIHLRRPADAADERASKLGPLAVFSLVRELRRGGGDQRPLAVGGARELSPISRRSCARAATRRRSSRAGSRTRRGPHLGRRAGRGGAARRRPRGRADRRVTVHATVPYVLATRPRPRPPGPRLPGRCDRARGGAQARRGWHGARRTSAVDARRGVRRADRCSRSRTRSSPRRSSSRASTCRS